MKKKQSLGSRVDRFLGVSRAFTSSCCKLNLDDNSNVNSITVKPVFKYDDADVDKVKIFADNREKSGVYLTSCERIKKMEKHMLVVPLV